MRRLQVELFVRHTSMQTAFVESASNGTSRDVFQTQSSLQLTRR